jgi:hypothetical protein
MGLSARSPAGSDARAFAPPLRPRPACLVVALAALAGACTSAGLPQVPGNSGQIETAAANTTQSTTPPLETVSTAPGEPTEVYALVARGIHGCWFGADGPLRGTHVFHAQAKPPAQGGQAEITIHERDLSMREQRGVQAFRVSIETAVGGSRVALAALKLPPGFGEPMVRDVEEWSKGRQGCQLRASLPRPEPPPKKPSAKADAKTASKAGTKAKDKR